MMFTNFTEFNNAMKNVASVNNTMVDCNDYSQYGWWGAAFMTDAFGGITVILHYDTNNKVLKCTHKEHEGTIIESAKQLNDIVAEVTAKLLKVRDLNAIYERVNAEY